MEFEVLLSRLNPPPSFVPPVVLLYDSLNWMTTLLELKVQMPIGPFPASESDPLWCATDRSIIPPSTPDSVMPFPELKRRPATPVLRNDAQYPMYTSWCAFGLAA